jgi:hypothetical protein
MFQDLHALIEEPGLSEIQAHPSKHLLDDLEVTTAGMCVHDDCEILAIHPVHPVTVRKRFGTIPNTSLRDVVFEQIREREVKMLSQIYWDTIGEYGRVNVRTVQHVLAELIDNRKITLITAPGSRKRSKAINRLNGGYVRWTSPLLFDPEGPLFDQVEDLIKARQRHG